MALDASNLSVQAIWDAIAQKKQNAEDERRAAEAAAKAERDALHAAFNEREVRPEALQRIAAVVRRAVENGEKRVQVLRFPSEWLPDSGRGITSHDPDWHLRLGGFPRRAYDYYLKELQPRGFQLQVEIVDWPGGMPGDCGWFLSWKHPEER
jgi:anti-sigma factor RsiW